MTSKTSTRCLFQGAAFQGTRLAVVLLMATVLISVGCNLAATGHNVQGRRLYEQGQFAQAIQMFQKSLQSNPRNADAYYNLASTYYLMGKQQRNPGWLQQADQLYRQALSLDPTHGDSYRGLASMMIENGRAAEAFQMVQNWRVQQPDSAEPVIELARMFEETGNRGQATQLLVDALNVDSTNAVALKAMGRMREQSGQNGLALENYIRSFQSNNLQTDVAQKIAELQGQVRSAQVVPNQPGQTQLGSVNRYVPR